MPVGQPSFAVYGLHTYEPPVEALTNKFKRRAAPGNLFLGQGADTLEYSFALRVGAKITLFGIFRVIFML